MYDVIIIGAGPAGISASLYIKRANLKTLILYKENWSLEKADLIENYYGFENGINGKSLYEAGIKQANNLGIKTKYEEVLKIEKVQEGFIVKTNKKEYKSKSVILATGTKRNSTPIDGIEKYEGRGISYCAICDGFFYKGKNIAVIGDGEYAISEIDDLLDIVKDITLLTNGEKKTENLPENILCNTKKIKQISGKERVDKVEFIDGSVLEIDGIFIAQGVASASDFAKKIGLITNNNKILVNQNFETNIKGIYACGDCVGGLLQVNKAAYEGSVCGLQVIKYIKNEGGKK